MKRVITLIWWHVPLSRENKEKLKAFVFVLFPFLFRNSRVYRNWHEAMVFSKQHGGPGERTHSGYITGDRRFSNAVPEYPPEPIPAEPVSELAIVIHAYYFDVFQEIMTYLRRIHSVTFRIFVTSPDSLTGKISALLGENKFAFESIATENRGRDILPFLEILPRVFSQGYQAILKIHTKKSDHRMSGERWRHDLYRKLITAQAMTQALRLFNGDHTIGIIGAQGHIVPMNLYYGANARRVESLSAAMGVHPSHLPVLSFPAGSMFYARKQALLPLLNLNITTGDFEDENGQKDGTMAHAVERAFAVSTLASNLKQVDISYDLKKLNFTITKDHPFTH